MTLPYSQFTLERALSGIRGAGYRYVAWGTTHREEGKTVPVLAADVPPARARELATRCRDLGLEPVMMFSGIYPEAKNGLEVLRQRILQAGAAKVPQVLTFGHTRGGNEKLWVERFKQLAPVAQENNVLLVVKQHGGETGTGAACAKITREVNHPHIKVNYDAGNVLDYLRGKVNPLTDLDACADEIRSFCIKDHRFFPTDQDCGPGLGEIDHYRLLHRVAFTGRTISLSCENISAPGVPRPVKPEGVDALARRAREFLELVLEGVQRV
jgi:sugar phosphate isomerase/epimerase